MAGTDSKSKTALTDALNLVTLFVKVLGCHIKVDPLLDQSATATTTAATSGRYRYCGVFFRGLYSFITNIAFFLFSCLLIVKLSLLTPLSSIWMKTFAISFLFLANAVSVIWATWKIQHNILQNWFKSFIRYEEMYGLNEKTFHFIRKIKLIGVVGPVLSIGSAIGVCVVITHLPNLLESVTLDYFPKWLSLTLLFIAFSTMSLCFITFVPLIVLGSVCLTFEFETVNRCMKDMMEYTLEKSKNVTTVEVLKPDWQNELDSKLSSLLRQHEHICDLLGDFECFINHIQLIDFFVTLPIGCIMLYFLITNIESTEDEVIAIFLIICATFYLIVLCLTGSLVNLKAHEPLKYIWKIPQSLLSETEARELLMFTAKMVGPPIGYSIYDLFTITFQSSLALLGTLLTYVIVVIQFKPSDREACGSPVDQNLLSNLTSLVQALYNSTHATA